MRSLQVHVPAGCPNKCAFCCSAAHHNRVSSGVIKFNPVLSQSFSARMNYAREHGCDVLMLTSTGEPVLNIPYIQSIIALNSKIRMPFDSIDLQTSGAGLNEVKLKRLRELGVTTIALSNAYICDDNTNHSIMRTPEKYQYKLIELCKRIKAHRFTLRLCLNLTSGYLDKPVEDIFAVAKLCGADQITIKHLYANENPMTMEEENIRDWVLENNAILSSKLKEINAYISYRGKKMIVLPGGESIYSIHGMSTVVMTDCQSQRVTESPRYYILRPNGKLYTRWDDDGSIIF